MRIGSLFSGYGGLDLAVESVFGALPAWFCEFEAAPSKVLATHWPSVPTLGDITAVDWSAVEPVDVITGGSPCQDLSHAGKRAGMTDGTRSNLWVQMREAIAVLRPSIVIWENVRGAYSADADSAVESCEGCLGDGSGPVLRALGRVLGDLSDLGYDCRWHGLRAADIGAPHGRFRVFIAAHAASWRRERWWNTPRQSGGPSDLPERRSAGVPTDAEGDRWHEGSCLEDCDDRPAGHRGPGEPSGVRRFDAWGQYTAAIRCWEHVVGRPAPAPTEPGTRGGQRLSPRFVEWMMGLPAGWVTDVPGISRNDQLKMLGNGVVPQQAAAAIRHMAVLECAA